MPARDQRAVAVADDGVKAEGIHLLVKQFAVHDLAVGPVDLQAVHVDHDAEVIQLIVVGKHQCFPALALFDLAVTQQGVHVDVRVPSSWRPVPCRLRRKHWPGLPVLISTPGTVFVLGWPCG